MIIARIARVSHSHEPEDKDKTELGRKLAVVAGLSDPGLSEIGAFIVRTAKAHVTIRSNDNEDRIERPKLAQTAGIL